MASMSYCRFENTEIDFRLCVADLEDAYTFEDMGQNEYETRARKQLYKLAQEYINQYERLLNAPGETEEWDEENEIEFD